MDFLPFQNKIVSGESFNEKYNISAKDKNVVVIGGAIQGLIV